MRRCALRRRARTRCGRSGGAPATPASAAGAGVGRRAELQRRRRADRSNPLARLLGCEIDGERHARGDGAVEVHHPLEFVRHEQVGTVRRRIGTDGLVRIARRIGSRIERQRHRIADRPRVFARCSKSRARRSDRETGGPAAPATTSAASRRDRAGRQRTPSRRATSGFVSGLGWLVGEIERHVGRDQVAGVRRADRCVECCPRRLQFRRVAVGKPHGLPVRRERRGCPRRSGQLSAGMTRISSRRRAFVGFGAEGVGWKLSTSQPARPEPCAATRLRHAPRSSFSTPPARQMFIQ